MQAFILISFFVAVVFLPMFFINSMRRCGSHWGIVASVAICWPLGCILLMLVANGIGQKPSERSVIEARSDADSLAFWMLLGWLIMLLWSSLLYLIYLISGRLEKWMYKKKK